MNHHQKSGQDRLKEMISPNEVELLDKLNELDADTTLGETLVSPRQAQEMLIPRPAIPIAAECTTFQSLTQSMCETYKSVRYVDPKTGKKKQAKVWWYHFNFAGRHIQASSKSTRKTVAVEAEKKRRLELEKGFNAVEDRRVERIRPLFQRAGERLRALDIQNVTLRCADGWRGWQLPPPGVAPVWRSDAPRG